MFMKLAGKSGGLGQGEKSGKGGSLGPWRPLDPEHIQAETGWVVHHINTYEEFVRLFFFSLSNPAMKFTSFGKGEHACEVKWSLNR
jgi:hypothetical protein